MAIKIQVLVLIIGLFYIGSCLQITSPAHDFEDTQSYLSALQEQQAGFEQGIALLDQSVNSTLAGASSTTDIL